MLKIVWWKLHLQSFHFLSNARTFKRFQQCLFVHLGSLFWSVPFCCPVTAHFTAVQKIFQIVGNCSFVGFLSTHRRDGHFRFRIVKHKQIRRVSCTKIGWVGEAAALSVTHYICVAVEMLNPALDATRPFVCSLAVDWSWRVLHESVWQRRQSHQHVAWLARLIPESLGPCWFLLWASLYQVMRAFWDRSPYRSLFARPKRERFASPPWMKKDWAVWHCWLLSCGTESKAKTHSRSLNYIWIKHADARVDLLRSCPPKPPKPTQIRPHYFGHMWTLWVRLLNVVQSTCRTRGKLSVLEHSWTGSKHSHTLFLQMPTFRVGAGKEPDDDSPEPACALTLQPYLGGGGWGGGSWVGWSTLEGVLGCRDPGVLGWIHPPMTTWPKSEGQRWSEIPPPALSETFSECNKMFKSEKKFLSAPSLLTGSFAICKISSRREHEDRVAGSACVYVVVFDISPCKI